MAKMFDIDKNVKKLFRMNGVGGGDKKDFILGTSSVFPVELPGTERTVMFAHQDNASDCGPCLVVNTCNVLGSDSYDSPQNVRQLANELRTKNRLSLIGDNDWLYVSDLALTMQQKGLLVDQYSIRSPAMETQARNKLSQIQNTETPFVVFSGTGRHFRGVYWSGLSYYILDSKLKAIPQTRIVDIENMIRNGKSSDRDETFAIVTRRSQG